MEQVSFFEHDGIGPARSGNEFLALTRLDCREVIGLIDVELSTFFTGIDGWAAYSQTLKSVSLADLIVRRASSHYSTFEPFRRECHGKHAKAYFSNFVRRWIAEEMRVDAPELHKKLPVEFRAAGMPIPRNRRAA
jgi:hypothetical protein